MRTKGLEMHHLLKWVRTEVSEFCRSCLLKVEELKRFQEQTEFQSEGFELVSLDHLKSLVHCICVEGVCVGVCVWVCVWVGVWVGVCGGVCVHELSSASKSSFCLSAPEAVKFDNSSYEWHWTNSNVFPIYSHSYTKPDLCSQNADSPCNISVCSHPLLTAPSSVLLRLKKCGLSTIVSMWIFFSLLCLIVF